MFVVTTDSVPGRTTRAFAGIVIGTVAVSTNKFDAGMKALDAADQIDRDETLRRDRVVAVHRMVEQAREWGANAVVGIRFEHRAVTGSWAEICAYGTAVVVDLPTGPAHHH